MVLWIVGIVTVCLLIIFFKFAVDQEVASRRKFARRQEEQNRQFLTEQRSRRLALQDELAQLNRQLRS